MSRDWLVCRQPKPAARLRLLCFPYAGGGVSVFAGWDSRLPDDVEIWSVRLPGRESRLLQRPYRQVDDLLPDLVDAAEEYCRKPFALFGHSMGALIAFEFARRMRDHGHRTPEHLLVSARRSPHLEHHRPFYHDLPDDALLERLKEFGGVPDQMLANRSAMRIVLPTLRADFQLTDTYSYRPSAALDCPITAFGGHSDPHVDQAELDAWAQLTTNQFRLHMLTGSHFFIHSARDELIRYITQALRQDVKQ